MANESIVISNCLCFLTNKFNKIPQKTLKSLILEFYTSQELSEAKELLLVDIDRAKVDNFPRITRHRRDSASKYANELDDMLTALTFMDEQLCLGKLSVFVASSPDRMPSVRLCDGDLEVVWSKLVKLEDMMYSICAANEKYIENQIQYKDMLKHITEQLESLKREEAINARKCKHVVMLHKEDESISAAMNENIALSNRANRPADTHVQDFMCETDIANGVHSLRKASHWGSIGSSGQLSDTDPEFDSNDMSKVISRRQLRALKRQRSSPDANQGPAKLARDVNSVNAEAVLNAAPSYVSKASNGTLIHKSNTTAVQRVIGRAEGGSIKAAAVISTPKSVYCVSNIGLEYTVNDLKKQCQDNGIRVLWCFDITAANRSSRAFKIAIAECDVEKFSNSDIWPRRVFLRQWNYKSDEVADNLSSRVQASQPSTNDQQLSLVPIEATASASCNDQSMDLSIAPQSHDDLIADDASGITHESNVIKTVIQNPTSKGNSVDGTFLHHEVPKSQDGV
jgi:hypothetical protein